MPKKKKLTSPPLKKFGIPEPVTHTPAQQAVLRAQRDPVWWVKKVLGDDPWEKQIEILESIRDYPKTAVRSCHGAGKSWVASRAVLWFLYTFPNSLVITTAPTDRQVRKILWREILAAQRSAKIKLGGDILTREIRINQNWMAFGFATKVPDNLQGLHAEHILVVVDEAVGIEPDLWDPIEALLTSKHARLLAIGNPTATDNYFFEMFKDPEVNKIKISAFDTPNFTKMGVVNPSLVTPEWVRGRKKRWGEDSPMYISRVLGEFPPASPNSLIPMVWIEAAQNRWEEAQFTDEDLIHVGIDCARAGDDASIVGFRRGIKLMPLQEMRHFDTMQVAGWVVGHLRGIPPELLGIINVDVVGIGAGVADKVREEGFDVVDINGGFASDEPDRYHNYRAHMFWRLRELFRSGEIAIPPDDEELSSQLMSIRYRFSQKGLIQIESKEDIKKRGLPSPDRADALAYTFVQRSDPFLGIKEYYRDYFAPLTKQGTKAS
ncbi:MAG: hypothetical protein KGL39_16575 [Patescibacteria group bacterium]|nr:hypothetical protein [Patescibacteria group bacterium]